MRTMAAALLVAAAAWAGDESKADAVRKLETMRVTVDFQDVRLSEAVDYLRDLTGLNFVVHAKAGEAEADAKVRLKAKDLTVKSILKLMLSGRNLVAAWKDGAVVILPPEELGDNTTLRMYDTRALLRRLQDFAGPKVELVSPQAGGGGPLAGASFTLDDPKPVIEEDFLLEMVKENTGGRTWDNPKSAMSLANGVLVVNQTAAVHREIQAFLAKLSQF